MLIELLYDALNSEHGLLVDTNDPERLRQQLYPLRKKAPELEVLSFVIHPAFPGQLAIVKRDARQEP